MDNVFPIPLGYQQITSLSTVKTLTVPAGTSYALIQCETQAVRWRMDGTDPTASVGMRLAVGEELRLDAAFGTIEFIEEAASAKLNVQYFGR